MFPLRIVIKILIAFIIFKTNASRILCVFPTPSYSHQTVYRSLTLALANRGHDVVVITTHPHPPGKSPANLKEIDVFEVSAHIWFDTISKVFHETNDDINIIRIYLKMFIDIFEKQIQYKPVEDLIRNDRDSFDLLLLESNVVPTLGLMNVFNVPVIQTSTFGPMPETYSVFGAPTHPLLYQTVAVNRLYNLSIWESIKNLYKIAINKYVMVSYEREDNEMLRNNLGSDVLPISKLYETVQVFLQSVYPIWMNNPPLPQSIVYLGGLHQKPPDSLPQNLQTFLNSSGSGVIYVSFGSNVHPSLLSPEKIDMMATVFSNLPYDILWKRDQSILTKTAKNIQISTWVPQLDLLYHPKIKLFITQGGLQSTEEAIMAGVPLIGIPIFGDQWINTEKYVYHGIGLQLDWNELTEEELTRSITTVINHKRYKDNVARLRNVMNDQPQSALDRLVWWTEYVIKHGGTAHLRPASATTSWLQYYEVELIGIVVALVMFVFGVFTLIIYRVKHCIWSRLTHTRHNKKM